MSAVKGPYISKYIQSLNEFLHLQAMVQEPESRFCSDQQTILQVLDPIHRSLLINNSEFESRLHKHFLITSSY